MKLELDRLIIMSALDRVYAVAKLEIDTITIYSPFSDEQPRAVYGLSGPRRFWPTWGNGIKGPHDEPFKLGAFPNTTIQVSSHNVSYWANRKPEEQHSVRVFQLSLSFDKEVEKEKFKSDQLFLSESILELTSFLSRQRNDWFFRKLVLGDHTETTYKSHESTDKIEPSGLGGLVEPFDILSIIKAYFNAKSFSPNHYKRLRWPVLYHIEANDSKLIQTEFAYLFWALEALLSIQDDSREFAIKRNTKCEITNAVKKLISEYTPDEKIAAAMHEKIPDLFRPTIRQVIDNKLSLRGRALRDYYGDKDVTFIKYRSELFHSLGGLTVNLPINAQALVNDTLRLSRLIEDMILDELNWQGKRKLTGIPIP